MIECVRITMDRDPEQLNKGGRNTEQNGKNHGNFPPKHGHPHGNKAFGLRLYFIKSVIKHLINAERTSNNFFVFALFLILQSTTWRYKRMAFKTLTARIVPLGNSWSPFLLGMSYCQLRISYMY